MYSLALVWTTRYDPCRTSVHVNSIPGRSPLLSFVHLSLRVASETPRVAYRFHFLMDLVEFALI
jgi:hypothetical protein